MIYIYTIFLSFLEFADLWSGVWIPACCAVPACRVWPVPSHTGRCPAHCWQHHCQRWAHLCATSVVKNKINNPDFSLSLQTQGIVRRCSVSPVSACWRPWLEWRRVAVWWKSFPPSHVFSSARLFHGQKHTQPSWNHNIFFVCSMQRLQAQI